MNEKRLFQLFLVTILIIGAISGAMITNVTSSSSTVVYVDPFMNSAPVGQQFTVDIKISDVTNLWGWQFILFYNTAVLETNETMIVEGPFLSQNDTYITVFDVRPGTGWQAWRVSCYLDVQWGVNGSGTLATVTFRVKRYGSTDIIPLATGLGTPQGTSIPHSTIGGFFRYGHDVAVRNVIAYPTRVSVGEPVFINVTVKNEGNETETFDVTAYYDNATIGTQPVTSLTPGNETTLTIAWDTTDVSNDTYTISANASLLEWEIDTDNNRFVDGNVTLTLAPAAIFTYSPADPLANETITFNATDSFDPNGYITSYEWNFGDGTPIVNETDPVTTHVYTSAGYYLMNLTVTDNDNETDTESKTIAIGKPYANFTFTPNSPIEDQTVTFNASSSTPRGGAITSYKWNFGDNTPAVIETDPIVTHTYTTYGTYIVTLNVTDSEGMWDTESKTITVRVPVAPVAAFTFTPTTPTAGDTVTFNATTSSDSDGNIVSYRWDFGDENTTTVTTPIITHTYKASGNYTVTLNVTDNDDLTDTKTESIKVQKAPSNIILYLAVAIVIIVIAAIAVYFLKVRKPS